MRFLAVIFVLLVGTTSWCGHALAKPVGAGVGQSHAGAGQGGPRAATPGSPRENRIQRPRKVVLVVARRRPLDGLRQALASQLASTGVQLELERVDHLPNTMGARFARVLAARTDSRLVLVAWCEQMGEGGDVLNVVDARHGRILLRAVKDCAGIEGAEEAALIVRTAVDVLRSGGAVGVSMPKRSGAVQGAATAVAPRHVRHSRRSSGRPGALQPRPTRPDGEEAPLVGGFPEPLGPMRLAGEMVFRLDSLADRLPADPGGGVGFLVRIHRGLFWTIDIWMSSPAQRDMRRVSFSLWRYSIETGLSYRWSMGRWTFGLGGSLAGEVRRLEMQAASGVVLGSLARVDGLVSAAAKFRVSVSLTDSLRLFLFGGFQVTVWGPSEYVVGLPDGGRAVAYDWWPVQPLSGLGLEVRLL